MVVISHTSMGYDIVAYDNSFNNQAISGIGVSEHNLLLGLLSKLRSEREHEVTIPIDEIEGMTGLKNPMPSQANRVTNSLRDKLLKTDFTSCVNIDSSGEILLFDIFEPKERRYGTIEWRVRLNEHLSHLVHNLDDTRVTKISMAEFKSVGNKYGKRLFRLLSQHRSEGEYTVSIDGFQRLMGFPSTYEAKEITSRVINPALRSCKSVFKGLSIEKEKTGRRITSYRLRFEVATSESSQRKQVSKMKTSKEELELIEILFNQYYPEGMTRGELSLMKRWFQLARESNERMTFISESEVQRVTSWEDPINSKVNAMWTNVRTLLYPIPTHDGTLIPLFSEQETNVREDGSFRFGIGVNEDLIRELREVKITVSCDEVTTLLHNLDLSGDEFKLMEEVLSMVVDSNYEMTISSEQVKSMGIQVDIETLSYSLMRKLREVRLVKRGRVRGEVEAEFLLFPSWRYNGMVKTLFIRLNEDIEVICRR